MVSTALKPGPQALAHHKRGTTAGRHIEQHSPLPKGRACAMCKARKVRCDAGLPACSACKRTARFEGRDPEQVCCSYSWKKGDSDQAPPEAVRKPSSLPSKKLSLEVPALEPSSYSPIQKNVTSVPLPILANGMPLHSSNKLKMILPANASLDTANAFPYKPLTVVTDLKPNKKACKNPNSCSQQRKLAPSAPPLSSSALPSLPMQCSPDVPPMSAVSSISLPVSSGFDSNFFTSNDLLTVDNNTFFSSLSDDDANLSDEHLCDCFLNDLNYHDSSVSSTVDLMTGFNLKDTPQDVKPCVSEKIFARNNPHYKKRANSFDSVESFDTMTTATTVSTTHSLESLPETDESYLTTGETFLADSPTANFDMDLNTLIDLPSLLDLNVGDEDITFC